MSNKVIALIIFTGLFICGYLILPNNNPLNDFPDQPQIQTPTVNQLSVWKPTEESLPQEPEGAILIAIGDISYSRGVEKVIKSNNDDINYPFLKIKNYLQNGDLVFGNLETPIIEGRAILSGEMIFRSNPGTEKALKEAGLTILSLANNHTPNFDQKGLLETFQYLEQEAIKYVGAGKNIEEAYQPVFIESKDIKFAFLAFTDPKLVPPAYEATENSAGTAFMKIEKLIEKIKEATPKADLVIVSMHAGDEYTKEPNDFQMNFAHSAIDAGADLVIGHHPHVIQTMEIYKDKYIFYSLGNFVFDQMWSQETKRGLALKISFSKDGVRQISFLPVVIENFSQPRLALDNEKEEILQSLKFPLADPEIYHSITTSASAKIHKFP